VTDFLLGAAGVVLLTVAGGLLRVLRSRGDAERMMAAQLLSTGGVAVLLLAGVAVAVPAVLDVALVLALLAAFAAIAFVKKGSADELPGLPADPPATPAGRPAGDA
jgi:multicomponent Na+:H+ antiporter subunit F